MVFQLLFSMPCKIEVLAYCCIGWFQISGSLMGRLRRRIVGAGHNNHKSIVRIAEQQQ